ncbi:MAG: hypothetical protein AAB356_01350, partial [Deltaproteobacteria bacterium]
MKRTPFALLLLFTIGLLLIAGCSTPTPPAPPEKPAFFTDNNYAFNKTGPHWVTVWLNNGNDYELRLRYNPRQTEDITIIGEPELLSSNLYLTMDFPNTTTETTETPAFTALALGASDLATNLATTIGITPQAACTRNITNTTCAQRPVITCDQANSDTTVIVIKNEAPALIT